MGFEKAAGKLVAEAHHTGGTARVEEVESERSVGGGSGFGIIEQVSVDDSGGFDKISFGVPVFDAVGDGGENVAPFGEPTTGAF